MHQTEEQSQEYAAILKEYKQLALDAGQLQYQIAVQKFELEKLNEQMSELNKRAIEAKGQKHETQ